MADSRIDDLRRRLERDPGSRLFAQLAEEYRKAGNHADAIRVARTGLASHPSYPSARLTLGRALLDSGDAAGARIELETALREAPDNILASRFLGFALEALGELGPALLQLQKTLQMAPGDRQLESKIVSLETQLRSPQAPAARPSAAPAPPVAHARGAAPGPATQAAVPPTIRLRPVAEPGAWGRGAPGPPPLPATAAPAAAAPTGPPPLPPPASPAAAVERRVVSRSDAYESDVAPTLPARRSPQLGLVDETTLPTLPPRALATEEMVFEAEPTVPPAAPVLPPPAPEPALVPEPPPFHRGAGPPEALPLVEAGLPGATPFSSSTLAELYLKQGLVDRAVAVYRRVIAEEPDNDRARSRVAEIERAASSADDRAARRRALERTIAGLEALLGAVQRR